MLNYRVLLFDLDGTLLRSDKTISSHTMEVLKKCREMGFLIGISTSRSEKNSLKFIKELEPDISIVSGGAVVKVRGNYRFIAEFTAEETRNMIQTARDICGSECEISIDTRDEHFWNYKEDPSEGNASWGRSIYTDFSDFGERALKMCVEIFDVADAVALKEALGECDCVKFSDGEWYKFTKKTATKEKAIMKLCEDMEITPDQIIAFGDDFADIGMLKLCGLGIAMGNAIDEVKAASDVVIGDNDHEGIAMYLEEQYL